MCVHTSVIEKVKDIELETATQLADEKHRREFDTPQYHLNGFAHPPMLIITQERNDLLIPAYWGIVPSNQNPDQLDAYYKKAVKFGGGLNARDDKLFDHFIYKNAIHTQKCLIPVSGFFEPHTFQKKKYPFYFKPATSKLLLLGGIYTRIENLVTFSIITKKASPLFEKIHNLKKRQPLLFDQETAEKWLQTQDQSAVDNFLNFQYNDDQLETYPVSKALFSPKEESNHKDIIREESYPELQFENL